MDYLIRCACSDFYLWEGETAAGVPYYFQQPGSYELESVPQWQWVDLRLSHTLQI